MAELNPLSKRTPNVYSCVMINTGVTTAVLYPVITFTAIFVYYCFHYISLAFFKFINKMHFMKF